MGISWRNQLAADIWTTMGEAAVAVPWRAAVPARVRENIVARATRPSLAPREPRRIVFICLIAFLTRKNLLVSILSTNLVMKSR